MGYMTMYSVSIRTNDSELEKKILREAHQVNQEVEAITDPLCVFLGPCKWYNHQEDLTQISLRFPDVLIELFGQGDDPFDLWTKYFWNGKVQTANAQIVFDAFDELKLT